jgi:nucleotide-binding universal stress UspA family protein
MTEIEATQGSVGETVVVWLTDGTWPGCVDAARRVIPADSRTVLIYVIPEEISAAAHAAYAGLLGRGHPERDPGQRVAAFAAASAAELLDAAADRIARPCERLERHGRVEREVVAAASGADLLIVARDGDRSRLGPKSLGPATRFVVDHAPCPVLLVWPEVPPGLDTIPHPPPRQRPPHS